MVDAAREVIFRFKGVVDPSVKKSLDDIAKAATRTAKVQRDASEASLRDQQKAAREAAKTQAATNQRTIGILKQQEREAVNAARTHEAAQRSVIRNEKILQRSLMGTVSSTMDLTRGLLLMGLAGEENTEKLLRGLVKIEATFAIIKGGIAIIQSASKAWTAYAAAVAGAAAVQAGVSGASSVRGSQKAAGGMAGTAAAGAAGAAAGTTGVGVAVMLAPLIAAGVAITGVIVGVASIISKDFREGLLELVGWTNKESDLREKFTKNLDDEDKLDKSRSRIYALKGGIASENTKFMSPVAALGHARTAVAGAYAPGQEMAGMFARREIANKMETQALERIRDIRKQGLDTAKEETAERVRGAKQELDTAKQTLKTIQDQANEVRDRYITAKEKFGQKTAIEQQELIALKRQADTKGWWTIGKEGRQKLREMDMEGTTAIARAGDFAEADRAGFDRFFGGEERRKAAALGQQATGLQRRIDAGVRVDNNVVVTLDTNVDAMVRQLNRQMDARMKPVFEGLERAISDIVKREYGRMADADRFKEGRAAAAAGGVK